MKGKSSWSSCSSQSPAYLLMSDITDESDGGDRNKLEDADADDSFQHTSFQYVDINL